MTLFPRQHLQTFCCNEPEIVPEKGNFVFLWSTYSRNRDDFWKMKRGVEAIARTVVQAARVRELVGASQSQRGPVVYWMSRDQRASDNWALLYASARATGKTHKTKARETSISTRKKKKKKKKKKKIIIIIIIIEVKAPLLVCFALSDPLFPGANWRSLHFMLHGLKEVAASLNRLNIEFRLLRGEPPLVVAEFLKTVKASLLVCDQRWEKKKEIC
jgi:deoxyribodipyrimidine photo-lyase